MIQWCNGVQSQKLLNQNALSAHDPAAQDIQRLGFTWPPRWHASGESNDYLFLWPKRNNYCSLERNVITLLYNKEATQGYESFAAVTLDQCLIKDLRCNKTMALSQFQSISLTMIIALHFGAVVHSLACPQFILDFENINKWKKVTIHCNISGSNTCPSIIEIGGG